MAGYENKIFTWRFGAGEQPSELELGPGLYKTMAISPDGELFALGVLIGILQAGQTSPDSMLESTQPVSTHTATQQADTPSPTLTAISTQTEIADPIRPINTPPFLTDNLIRVRLDLTPGEEHCLDLNQEFGFDFYNPLIRNVYPFYEFLNYTVEERIEWPEQIAVETDFIRDPPTCLSVDPGAPEDNYHAQYHVTIYEEKGVAPNPETRQYLIEGTAYLEIDVVR